MKIKNYMGEVFEVSVGDYVGWKADREMSGKVQAIKNGWLKIQTETRIQQIDARRCWPE